MGLMKSKNSMKKKLAIICANPDQIPLVTKANEMGIETHCFSWDKKGYNFCSKIADYFHPISILEKEQILEKCREIQIDGVTSILNDYAVPTMAYVAQEMGLPGNRYEDMIVSDNKFTMRQNFTKHGIRSPRYTIAHEETDLKGFKYPLIVKPTDRCFSVGVIKVEKEEDLRDAILKAQQDSYRKEAIIEEFIPGREGCVHTISNNGKHHILAIYEKEFIIVNQAPWKIAGHYPFELPNNAHSKIVNETFKILDSINFKNGVSNNDFKITDDDKIFTIEINPRMASEYLHILLKLHNGYDVLKGVIDVALGQFEEPVFPYKKYSGIYYCGENTNDIKQAIENKERKPDIVEARFYDKEEIGFGRIGHVIYQSDRKWRLGNHNIN